MPRTSTRRQFLKHSALAGAGFWILGGSTGEAAEQRSPNEKLNIAGIGVGGQGAGDIGAVSSQNIVALCDVDEKRAGSTFQRFPRAERYNDFRRMLEKKNIDAVVVATPDNCHAVASVMAMKLGKAVYCEKPLTHDVYEARKMREVAREKRVATQMGNQGTSGGTFRRAAELIREGAIGPVKEVHVWTNRPIWPQGMKGQPPAEPVPKTLQWELWLGPAHDRPYNHVYLPFVWRGWWDFGTGALGDMACHTMNLPYFALKLGSPKSVQAKSSDFDPHAGYPTWATVHYEFPARGEMPAVQLNWYEGHRDGKRVLPGLELQKKASVINKNNNKKKGQDLLSGSGSITVGEKGILYSPDDYGGRCYLIRNGEVEEVKGPPRKLPSSPGHHQEWIRAAKGGEPAMSNFDYAGMLTETVLLGNVAIRARGRKLDWEGPNLKITNDTEANKFLRRQYRKGWSL